VCLRYSVLGYYSNKYSLCPACCPSKLSIRFIDTIEDSNADLELAGKSTRDFVRVMHICYYYNTPFLVPPFSSL
ncbi:hypothetical protein L249_5396, partial [Ophiocordyceps polyrhachis-furcata BCC 54312]